MLLTVSCADSTVKKKNLILEYIYFTGKKYKPESKQIDNSDLGPEEYKFYLCLLFKGNPVYLYFMYND